MIFCIIILYRDLLLLYSILYYLYLGGFHASDSLSIIDNQFIMWELWEGDFSEMVWTFIWSLDRFSLGSR